MNSKKLTFFTYFDSNFLIQGTVALHSFLQLNPDTRGIIYCTDDLLAEVLKRRFRNQPIDVIKLATIPDIAREMKEFAQHRSPVEILVSLKPFLILETLKQVPRGELLVYFDADLFFYQSISSLVSEIESFSVLFTRHVFPESLTESSKYGLVNAGFILLRNTREAVDIVNSWAKQCRNWCFLRLEEGKYGDQKYLDDYLTLSGVKAISHPGINNGVYYFQERRKLSIRSKNIMLDNQDLICFHFHGIRVTDKYILTGFNRYSLPHNTVKVWSYIYQPYIKEIRSQCEYYEQIMAERDFRESFLLSTSGNRFGLIQIIRKTVVARHKCSVLNLAN